MKNIITKLVSSNVSNTDIVRSKDMNNLIDLVSKKLQSAEMEAITESLQHLIQNGLLRIELGRPELVALADSSELQIRNTVRVVCTQQERLDFLEKRNKELQELVDQINKITK